MGRHRSLVAVRDHDVDQPKPGTLEIRASGLWAEPVCETPFDHWSLGLEALAVALDDPTDAYGAERGEPIALGLDLEWEASGDPEGHAGRYGQACEVHGEVLVGRERLPVAGAGTREHTWGERQWWGADAGWAWAAGRLDDGTAVGLTAEETVTVELDDRGLVTAGQVVAPDGQVARLGPVLAAPLLVPSPDGSAGSRLARALCRLEAPDGRRGWAWSERLYPA